jgi:AcrR family transcriptional regulator
VGAAKKLDGRRERSRLTRRRIVDAATGLFVRDGYLATTIEDVADHAGVAVQTVYYVFGTKPKLLAAVLDTSIAGDVEPAAVLQQGWVDWLRAEPDATLAVQHLVEAAVTIVARATPIYEVIRRAAADPDVGTLLDDTRRRRRHDQRQLIEILAHADHLHPDVNVETAADVLYGLINEEVFQLLSADCAWPIDRFVNWATALLQQQLLSAGPPRT